jgi:GntP family gluconate:H+ symporter
MDMPVSIIGVLVGLAISIILIIKKLNPVSSMFLGTIIGAIVGGASLYEKLFLIIIPGGYSVVGIIVRIIAGGVLAGVLIESGAAESIAKGIIEKLGEKRALLALTLSSMILLAIGIFLPVSVVILAPIALSVAHKAKISKFAAILALSGGAKAGNIISPNPNTISVAEAFNLSLSNVMINGFIPGFFALITTIILVNILRNKGAKVEDSDLEKIEQTPSLPETSLQELPPFRKAIAAPVVVIFLLMLRPIGNAFSIGFLLSFYLDAFIVLPIGAIIGALVMGKGRNIPDYINKGIIRMAPVVLMLLGAGALTGLITNSVLPNMIVQAMYNLGIPLLFLAPISGVIMGAATGSAATGVIVAGSSFADILLMQGVPALSAAVMIHAGSALFDVVPHGNYFLASIDSMKIRIVDRMKVMPYEAIIGTVMTIVAVVMYGFILL